MFVVDLVRVAFANEAVLTESGLEGRLCFRADIMALGHWIVPTKH